VLNQVNGHVPLAAVADNVSRQMINQPIIYGEICVLNREFEEIVRFVEFVPKEEIGLGVIGVSKLQSNWKGR
jgi:hypothetical protein